MKPQQKNKTLNISNMEAKFKNNQLNSDLEKIKSYNTLDIEKSIEESFDYPYCIDLNGESYLYSEESDRDFDYNLLPSLI